MRILAVGAHPDDLEILCSGTLGRYVKQGHHVIMAHVCRGDKGHWEIPHHEVGVIRDKETQAAADAPAAAQFHRQTTQYLVRDQHVHDLFSRVESSEISKH